ncbi:MAG: hypothetical protein ACOYVF_07865 [Candidatus Zixiibacteriota bacterium]
MNPCRIGLDCRREFFYTARVQTGLGRPEVHALVRFKKGQLPEYQLLQESEIYFCVPDDEVIVKKVRVSKSNIAAIEQLVEFELSRSMLDSEDNFRFSYLPVGNSDSYLGFVYRRHHLEEMTRFLGLDLSERSLTSGGYLIRAAALGKGYLNFCRPVSEELVCLADINDRIVSICFLYKNRIINLGYMNLAAGAFDSDSSIRKAAIDFKTLVNFKLSALSENGVTVPLSGLVMCGDGLDTKIRTIFAEFFPVGVAAPSVIGEYFVGNEVRQRFEIPLEKYLVALGLAVN